MTIELGGIADWVSGLGSLAAVIVALKGFRIVEKQRGVDRLAVERGVANEIVAAIIDMGNNIRALELHVRLQRNDMSVRFRDGSEKTFRGMNPMIGLSTEGEVPLPVGSTELLVKAGATDLWNDARLLVRRNRSLTSLFKEYQVIWGEFVGLLPAGRQLGDAAYRFEDEGDLFERVQGELVRMDFLVRSIEDQVVDTGRLLDSVAAQIGPVMKKYFNEPFIHLGDPKGEASAKTTA